MAAAEAARTPKLATYTLPKDMAATLEILKKKTSRRLAALKAADRQPWLDLYKQLDSAARRVTDEPDRAAAIHQLAITALCSHHSAAMGTVAASRSTEPFPTEIFYRNLAPPPDQAALNKLLDKVVKGTWREGDLDLTYVLLNQYAVHEPGSPSKHLKPPVEGRLPDTTLMVKFTCQDPHRMGRLVAALADPEWALTQQPEFLITNSKHLLERPARWIPTYPPGAPEEQSDIRITAVLKPLCDDPLLTHNPYDSTVASRRTKDIIVEAIQEFSCRRVLQILGPNGGWELVHNRALTRKATASPLTC